MSIPLFFQITAAITFLVGPFLPPRWWYAAWTYAFASASYVMKYYPEYMGSVE
jgi:hypothetical protein